MDHIYYSQFQPRTRLEVLVKYVNLQVFIKLPLLAEIKHFCCTKSRQTLQMQFLFQYPATTEARNIILFLRLIKYV